MELVLFDEFNCAKQFVQSEMTQFKYDEETMQTTTLLS